MFPQVWEKVVSGRYRSATATVSDHARYQVREASYPGMVAECGSIVTGTLYFDVEEADLQALDAFEGSDYARVMVTAVLSTQDKEVAQTYLIKTRDRLRDRDWDPKTFNVDQFVRDYRPD